ncbi:MAG: exodeoxyribonuclease VII large subunit [Flavobacteriia bacterium]|nr:exodeoxyribonuclease VII large subunit [Flavobacteriia bacterium]OJX36131.1 MAG: exodeoxyribonuclease VII large subunit [Flavobacteriia bacterium 40-80]
MNSEKKTFTLLQLAASIQRAIQNVYSNSYWVKAEMHKLNRTSKGHCYPELVQKENGEIVAEMRGTIWKTTFEAVRKRFEEIVKEPLRDGLTLLFQVKVTFHPVYGMGLEVLDIDPNYTLGALQKEREETLINLKNKGLLNKNQQLSLPLLPKNIAIISIESSKGLSDFLSVLKANTFGYGFNTRLFPAILNGDGAVESIIFQLGQIKKYAAFFDAVVIVRGGGGEIGMTCYNNYELCEAITTFPLPVLTGIGHSTNLTVAEMIAFRSAITPTQLADFFVENFHAFAQRLKETQRTIIQEADYLLADTRKAMINESRIFRNSSIAAIIAQHKRVEQTNSDLLRASKNELKTNRERLLLSAQKSNSGIKVFHKLEISQLKSWERLLNSNVKKRLFEAGEIVQNYKTVLLNKTAILSDHAKRQLNQMETTVKLVDPVNVLRKGYTLSLFNGKSFSKDNFPGMGDVFETISTEGTLKSKVVEREQKAKNEE